MKLKKLLSLGLVAVMTASSLVGCASKSDTTKEGVEKSEGPIKIGMVTDTGGVNDEYLSLIHISEPTRPHSVSRMPSSA